MSGGADTRRARPGARDLIELVLEKGSFLSWDEPIPDRRPDEAYAEELREARRRTGVDESVLTGEGRVGQHRVAVVVGEFGFLGGSIGVDAAARIMAAVRRATREGLPVLAAPASGGTRMQEGTVAFVQMVGITATIAEHRKQGLPYLVYLRHPTTGGVFASWGSLGHVTVAEPGAMIGFLGPRVYRAMYGADFPENVQTAENLQAHGLVDAVLAPEQLGALAAGVLDAWSSHSAEALALPEAPATDEDDWQAVVRSRSSARPGLRSVLRHATMRTLLLSGTGRGESDPTLTLAITRFGGQGVVVLGQDRRSQDAEVALGPGALRVAGRGIRLAVELGLPLVTVIDTPGAALSREAEEGGLASEIARCLLALLEADVPTVSVILGQGAGGAALALLPADRILVAENGWLSPLPPEGAAAIVHRDSTRAPELARRQRIGAPHLLADRVVDEIIPEGGDAPAAVAAAITRALASVVAIPPGRRLRDRRSRFSDLVPSVFREDTK
ncbi:carboxyl transferase domain-containing protein [Homoserinibacter sp. GY 40078]|uniref:carboxyl transferase domain-containing protein n=1 Tax=Homoserinibacter sp. GY 40078 TaxID=2603275 RepID=UPI0011CC353E|nr:carboxyl transferase domain-containing protein [Homoserinibacter sp. GY 40078]TXK16399.1 acetyl-CoA carboxyl transferase [Homoserinibacter sp. GY 40078]